MEGKKNKQYAIIGLGRFGISILKTLAQHDVTILAVDKDADVLDDATQYATHVVQADVGDEDAVRQLELGGFDVVVLAMTGDFEATIITTMIARENGCPYVLAKARTHRQKAILETMGAVRVVLPEEEMGRRVGMGLLQPMLQEVLEQSGDDMIGEIVPKPEWVGRTVGQADIRKKEGITILALRRQDSIVVPVDPNTVLEKDDKLIVLSGKEA